MTTLLATVACVNAIFAQDAELWRTFCAVARVESHGDPRAYNRKENAVGIVQIRPVMLADANRIAGRQRWTLADRTNPAQSWEIFRLVCLHYQPNGTPEEWARVWNGGPSGCRKAGTRAYWLRVRAAMNSSSGQIR